MKTKSIAMAVLLASAALAPVSPLTLPARADGKDVVAGLIIGGIIGSAITNENNKKKRTANAGSKSTKSGISAEQREANKEVQVALNYFGYSVGTADGSIGPKSRAQIKEYQAFLGYPVTGELTDPERTVLVTAYHRAVAGGPVIAEAVAGSPYGLKAVLIAQRDEMGGVAPGGILAGAEGAPAPGSVAAAAAAALPRLVPDAVSAEEAPVVKEASAVVPAPAPAPAPVVAPEPEAVAAAQDPALPSFISPAGAKGSLATACADVAKKTAALGGLTTAEGLQDAGFALSEQFCVARDFAIADGEKLAAQVAGFTPEQIADQCKAFGPVLQDHVAALSIQAEPVVLKGVQDFVLTAGMSPAQLAGTAKVCLGVGYATDDMEVAIGSALLLTALGQTGYAEYLGHHLAQGFGAAERPDLALDWFQLSLDAIDKGQLVVAPELEGRDAVIRKAAYTLAGRADELPPDPMVQEAALPVFEVTPEAATEEPVATAVAAPAAEVAPVPAPAPVEVAVVKPAAEPVPEPLPEVVAEAPAPLPVPAPAPVLAAPKLPALGTATPAPLPQALAEAPATPAPLPAAGDAGIVQAGTQAAVMAARLPFLIFSSY